MAFFMLSMGIDIIREGVYFQGSSVSSSFVIMKEIPRNFVARLIYEQRIQSTPPLDLVPQLPVQNLDEIRLPPKHTTCAIPPILPPLQQMTPGATGRVSRRPRHPPLPRKAVGDFNAPVDADDGWNHLQLGSAG